MVNRRLFNSQQGAALVVALVLLAAITIVGVSNMQSTMLEMKMVTSTMDRNKAFAIAEGGLIEVEKILEKTMNLSLDELYTDSCSSNCFTATCDSGLCFEGKFDNNEQPYLCEVFPHSSSSIRTLFWRDSTLNVWESGKHKTVNVGLNKTKYIIEFLCFVDDGNGVFGPPGVGDPTAGDPLFRITVFVEGEGGLSPVMLQSTYSFPL